VNFNLILKYNRCIMRIFSLIFCILNAELINAQSPTQDSLSTQSVKSDSSFSPKDSSKTTNRIAVPTDTSVVVDTIEAPKSDIDTRIQYSCRDSIRMSMAEQRVYLYGEAKVVYGTKNIQAEYLIINWVTNEVSAYGKLDTLTDNTIGKPLFKDGSDMYIADSIRYNMKSGKGIIKGIVTRQGDGFIHGGPVKRTTEAIYVKHALYTTCDLPHPHFSINATKLKVIPGDKVVTGPFHMEIMGIPTPLGLPLGFFPVTQRSKSGIIPPGIGESTSRGFNITNGGYYWAVNDYVGTNVFGDLYANKSYRISTQTNYIKRYCYSGLTAFSYSNIKEGFADTIKAPKLFNFRWTHKTLGNKPSRLSADVNISSSKYYTSNSYNPINQQSTNFASNITWSKTFRNSPFNVSAAFRQDQNTLTKAMTATLPEVNVSMNRIYPFKSKVNPGNKWYEKINVSYNGSTKYTVTNHLQNVRLNGSEVPYADTTINIQGNLTKILNEGQWGVHNTVPIGTTFKVLKYFSLNPSLNIENWVYANRLNYNISHTQTGAVVVQASPDKKNGLNTVFSGNFTTALTTRIYGTYRVNTKFLQGIRHTLIPTFTYTYRPDIQTLAGDNAFYTNSAIVNKGKETPYSRYQGYVYGGPASGTVNSLSISLQNTIEGKARNRKDTTGLNATKKIKLIENLSVAGAYNFSADSLKWSLINLNARSRLFDKIDINYTGTFDPYQTILDSVHGTTLVQSRVDRLALESKTNKKFLILTNYNIALSTNLNPNGQKSQRPISNINPNAANYIIAGADQYVDFTIPWNLFISYNISYSKIGVAPASYVNSLTFNGDIKVSDNWKIKVTSGFDIVQQKLGYTTINIYRDLHCWQMNLNVVPFGDRQSFMFTLNAKSSLLTDLKINKRNSTYNGGY
jgi:hypothetical protein